MRTAVILFFIANEGFSIVENAGIMGVPMPPAIKNAFAAIKSKADKTE
ncbi:phage holin family protein [Faecalispora jeddahensis]|nr:phage holin family protein [Faecalispora jeddahensis]